MPRWFEIQLIRQIQVVTRSKWARPTATVLVVLFVMPVAVLAQGSPFDTGFNAIQSLFTGTIAKVASLVAIVIGGYGFAHGEPGAKKALAGVAAGTGIAVTCGECPELALGRIAALSSHRHPALRRGSYARQTTAEASHKSSLQEPA